MFHEAIRKVLENGGDLETAMEVAAKPKIRMLEMVLKRTPFVPFRISMTSGSIQDINHPDEIVVGSTTASLRRRVEASGAYEVWSILALIHIVSIEFFAVDQPTIISRQKD
jgi:hypothetical protein